MAKEFSPYSLEDVAKIMEKFPDPDRVRLPIDARDLNPYDLNDVALINSRRREIKFVVRRRHVHNHNNRGLLKVD
jgi:hypothetical protein